MTLQIHQDRAEAVAAPKREVVYAQKQHRASQDRGHLHNPTQDRLASGLYP